MSVKSIWKGTLSVGVVSVGVKAYKATDDPSSETSMRQLHSVCSHPINERKVCFHCDPNGKSITQADVVKGVEVAPDKFVVMTDEDIKSIRPQTAESIVVETFVPAGSIDPLYYGTAYYLAPDKGQNESFALMVQAMTEEGKIAQSRMALYGREYIVTVRPQGSMLILQLMKSKNEVRVMDNIPTYVAPGAVAVKPQMVKLAKQLMNMYSDVFDATEYESTYVAAFKALVESKVTGVAPAATAAPANTVSATDLMSALEASLATLTPKKTKKAIVKPVEVKAVKEVAKPAKKAKRA